MSNPQQSTPKGSRRTARPNKHNGQNARSAMSETEAYASGPMEQDTSFGDAKQKSKRKSHASKRSTSNHEAGVHSDGPAPRSITHSETIKGTPIKQQAYAGPTFHQSPAASALPIPKYFLAKSLPNTSVIPSSVSNLDQSAEEQICRAPPVPVDEPKRESTPLDFLFDAARKAQTTPRSGSPHQKHLSPAVGSPLSRSPARREGETQFPFEFDSADATPGEDGSSFSTPYKQRIEAVKISRGTPDAGRKMEESERIAKATALKDFLKNSAQHNSNQVENPFNARPVPQKDMGFQHGTKQYSNPSTPMRNGHANSNSYQYFPPMPYMQNGVSPGPKPPGSNLRNIYSPDLGRMPAELSSVNGNEEGRISTARHVLPPHQHSAQQYDNRHYEASGRPVVQAQQQGSQSTPSVQQLEDDLRRVLKVDLTSQG